MRLKRFEVVGFDIKPQPNYPFEFHEADALTVDLSGFDVVHASPPCQALTTMSNRWRGKGGKADSHDNLIPLVRDRLLNVGPLVYVIENVPGARPFLRNCFVLTGGQFGLRVHRPRLFESSVRIVTPPPARSPVDSIGVYGERPDGRLLYRRKDGTEQRAASSLSEARSAMGMPWADWRGCAEAIPPAYTEYIGRQVLTSLFEPH